MAICQIIDLHIKNRSKTVSLQSIEHPQVGLERIGAVTRTSWGPRGLDVWYCGLSVDNYRCSPLFVPETGTMRISCLYNLFSQHCIMSPFTHEQHVTAVNDRPQETILGLDNKAKKRLLVAMAKLMENITMQQKASPQRVDPPSTSEGVPQGNRAEPSPPVTPTTNPAAPT